MLSAVADCRVQAIAVMKSRKLSKTVAKAVIASEKRSWSMRIAGVQTRP